MRSWPHVPSTRRQVPDVEAVLADRVAIISGGSRGIGLGIAASLRRRGCRVVLAARTVADLQEAEKKLDSQDAVLTKECDVTNAAAVKDLVDFTLERLNRLDIVVCAQGVYGNAHSAIDY